MKTLKHKALIESCKIFRKKNNSLYFLKGKKIKFSLYLDLKIKRYNVLNIYIIPI